MIQSQNSQQIPSTQKNTNETKLRNYERQIIRTRIGKLINIYGQKLVHYAIFFSPGDLMSREIQWLTLKMILKDHTCKIFLVM